MFSMAEMTVVVMPMEILMTVTEIVTLTITSMMIMMMTVMIVMCRKRQCECLEAPLSCLSGCSAMSCVDRASRDILSVAVNLQVMIQ